MVYSPMIYYAILSGDSTTPTSEVWASYMLLLITGTHKYGTEVASNFVTFIPSTTKSVKCKGKVVPVLN
jgi:hypothetical protein